MFIYCGNNPINRIDISGADSEEFDGDPNLKDEKEVLSLGPGGDGKSSGGIGNTRPGGEYSNYAGNSGRTEIHHIVEQCQSAKSGFTNEQIQAQSNKVRIDYATHRAISGYYSSKQSFTNGMRVRDWLAGQSFAEQTAFGWSIIDHYYTLLWG